MSREINFIRENYWTHNSSWSNGESPIQKKIAKSCV